MMRKTYYILLVLATAFLSSGYTVMPTYCLTDPAKPHIAGAESLVKGYLEAVDRGELISFDRKLGRSEIVPVRVEYIYQIGSGATEIKVYSELKEPMIVPGQPGAKVLGVRSVLEGGKIVETESHVWIE